MAARFGSARRMCGFALKRWGEPPSVSRIPSLSRSTSETLRYSLGSASLRTVPASMTWTDTSRRMCTGLCDSTRTSKLSYSTRASPARRSNQRQSGWDAPSNSMKGSAPHRLNLIRSTEVLGSPTSLVDSGKSSRREPSAKRRGPSSIQIRTSRRSGTAWLASEEPRTVGRSRRPAQNRHEVGRCRMHAGWRWGRLWESKLNHGDTRPAATPVVPGKAKPPPC